MTDDDLKFLKDLPVPAPGPGAKSAALQSSLEAFAQGKKFPLVGTLFPETSGGFP